MALTEAASRGAPVPRVGGPPGWTAWMLPIPGVDALDSTSTEPGAGGQRSGRHGASRPGKSEPMHASIAAIEYHLPAAVLTSAELAGFYPTGRSRRSNPRRASKRCTSPRPGNARPIWPSRPPGSCSTAAPAAPPRSTSCCFARSRRTTSPRPSACVIQDRLGIGTSAAALDFNLGCSGYVYGLGLAEALISSGQASNILLLTADTLTRFVHPKDKSVRLLFGDAGAATLLRAADGSPSIGPFVYGTDGKGCANLIIPPGGCASHAPGENPRRSRTTWGTSGRTSPCS